MRTLLLTALSIATIAACSAERKSSTDHKPVAIEALSEDTRLAAVLIYADWCSSCKILDPKLTAAKAKGSIDGLSHVILDYTKRDEEAFFAQADQAGIGEAIRAQLGDDVITGILLLVDVDDKKVVADLRKELSPEELHTAMVNAASKA